MVSLPRPRSTYAVIGVAVGLLVGAIGFVYYIVPPIGPGGPTIYDTEYATSFANSTFTFQYQQGATADYYLVLNLVVTCRGCSFTGNLVVTCWECSFGGEYRSALSTAPAPVSISGNGSRQYGVESFDSPISIAWNISKDSAAGTLTVTPQLGSQALTYSPEGNVYYTPAESTSAPYGILSGAWSIAVLDECC